MYYSKEQLERIRKEGEEKLKEMELESKGYKYKANTIPVICVHCKHEQFEKSEALLNSRGLTFFDLDWLNEAATILICKRCGYIHWFGKGVEKVTE